MNRTRIFGRLLLLISSTLFTCLAAEAFLRLFPQDANLLYHPKILWNHWKEPNLPGDNKDYFPAFYNERYRYDEVLGFERKEVEARIREVRRSRPDSFKILILGDSITEISTYADRFALLMKKEFKNRDIQVINAGVIGYDTELEYRYLKHRGMELPPDLVIVQFCPNDFYGTPVIVKQKDGTWLALEGGNRLSSWVCPRLLSLSRLYEFVMLRLLYLSRNKTLEECTDTVKLPLRRIKNLLEENHIPFLFLIFPRLDETSTGLKIHKTIKEITAELDLAGNTVDLRPAFSKASFGKIALDEFHPNPEGDKIAARILLEKVIPIVQERRK